MDSPPITDRTVLVTGGAGFVGSHLADALADRNDLRILDNFSSGHREYVPDGATVIEGDIRDADALARATRNVDLIFHEAAAVSVEVSVEQPAETSDVNLAATLSLLEHARRADARVVVASSAAVYGHPERVPVAEGASKEPTSPYGVQKLAADHYTRLYHDLYDLPTVALRYFNIYGPRQQGPYSGVISTFLEQARAGEPLSINGDGEQTRDFIHVSDVVRANLRAARTDHVGEAFNIATGETTTIAELATLIRKETDSDSPIVYTDPRPGDIRQSQAVTQKARQQLGFEPKLPLATGVRQLVHTEL